MIAKNPLYNIVNYNFNGVLNWGWNHTWYFGASLLKNSWGPIILPVQYMIKYIELTVAFFVKPPTLELIIAMEIGIAAE